MAKKSNSMTWIIVGLAVLLIAFIVYGNQKKKRLTKGGASADGCYPMEEVHETSTGSGRMWVCIIPMAADNVTTIRPPSSEASVGSQFTIGSTGSALDGTYTIQDIWYDTQGDIGCLKVDIPGGYNFNYNATQGGSPRDMTYFGVGQICFI